MRFLVTRTVSYFDEDPWRDDVDVENEAGYINARVERLPRSVQGLAHRWYEFQFSLRLLRRCRRYDALAVGRYGMWFPVMLKLLGIKKRVVMTDTEWNEIKGGRLNRAAGLASSVVCSNTRIEIERYSRQYGIPREKFALVPLSFQKRYLPVTSDEGYIFSGGTVRDWKTLFDAVTGLPYPVRVFTPQRVPQPPSNVTVELVGREEFYARMAAASCVAIALEPEPLRITGTTTWTAAMAMGKPVVVSEPHGAPDYMEHGVSGFYVGYKDPKALRHYIELVMRNPSVRKRVGEAARERAWREFSPEVFRRRVLALLEGGDVANWHGGVCMP